MRDAIRRLVPVVLCIAVLAGCSAVATPSHGAASPGASPLTVSPSPAASATPAVSTTPAASAATATFPAEPIDREAVLADPEAVAELLADPSRSGDGVVSLLASLGIGIYTPDGQQILRGSETSSDDFFLYDFEVPLLASMAGARARPFLEFHEVLANAGYTGSPADLALGFATAFGEHPEAFMPRLFAAMAVSPDQPDLTPLQSWLLLLTLAPLNGEVQTTNMALAAAGPLIAQCGGIITGSGVQPLWGVGPEPWLDGLQFQNAVDMYYALHGPMLVNAVSGLMTFDPPSVHEGHGGPGQASQLSVRMDVVFVPQHVALGGCGNLINLMDPVVGPVAGVPVEWLAANDLTEHGALTVPPGGSRTDADGNASVTFTAQPEAADGQGTEQSLTGAVTALLPAQDVFQSYLGISDSRLLVFVPPKVPVSDVLTVTWHGPEPSPSPSPLAVGDPCSLITQAEAEAEAGEAVRPGFQVPTEVDGLGVGAGCVFRDADYPSGEFGIAHIRIDVLDLGPGGGQRFAAAGLGLSDGHVPDLGDDNFYFCDEACGPGSVVVRRANLAILVSDLAASGVAGATRLARLALQRIDAR